MKKQYLVIAIMVAVVTILTVSCDKKKDTTMTMDVTMTYTPNPAIKDSTITFEFKTTSSGMMMDVMNPMCEVMMGSSTMPGMAITSTGTGTYKGTYKFTSAGTYAMHFGYMMDNVSSDKDFNCVVQ